LNVDDPQMFQDSTADWYWKESKTGAQTTTKV